MQDTPIQTQLPSITWPEMRRMGKVLVIEGIAKVFFDFKIPFKKEGSLLNSRPGTCL
jgi:hypothetical protein